MSAFLSFSTINYPSGRPISDMCAFCTFLGVHWRHLHRYFRMHHLALYLYVPHQARSPRRDFRGRIMKVCRLTKMHRARKMVVGALSEAGAVSSSVLSKSETEIFPSSQNPTRLRWRVQEG